MMHKISRNENISHFDPNQITELTFDNSRDAVRVHIVDGLTLTASSINMPEQKTIQVPVIVKEAEIHQINVPVIVKEIEYKTIEVPVIVKEIEYKTIEVPVIVKEVQVVTIEKPVVVTEFKVIEKTISSVPNIVKICVLIQTIVCVGLLLTNIFLKGR